MKWENGCKKAGMAALTRIGGKEGRFNGVVSGRAFFQDAELNSHVLLVQSHVIKKQFFPVF